MILNAEDKRNRLDAKQNAQNMEGALNRMEKIFQESGMDDIKNLKVAELANLLGKVSVFFANMCRSYDTFADD
jgi:hypothetical protein